MKALKIVGEINVNVNIPKDAEIVTVTLQEYLETEYEEKFEFIFCVHVLQTLWAAQVGSAIKKLVDDLAHKGELHIYTPAVEQASRAFLKGENDPVTFYQLWGTKENPNHCGFTLYWLRALVLQAGALVRKANMTQLKLSYDENDAMALGHMVIATVIRE